MNSETTKRIARNDLETLKRAVAGLAEAMKTGKARVGRISFGTAVLNTSRAIPSFTRTHRTLLTEKQLDELGQAQIDVVTLDFERAAKRLSKVEIKL